MVSVYVRNLLVWLLVCLATWRTAGTGGDIALVKHGVLALSPPLNSRCKLCTVILGFPRDYPLPPYYAVCGLKLSRLQHHRHPV